MHPSRPLTPSRAAPPAARLCLSQAKILICHGAADEFVPADMIASFKGAMSRLQADWTWIEYGGAVHAFTNPDAGKFGLAGVAYQEAAARRSWGHMRQFLREALGE